MKLSKVFFSLLKDDENIHIAVQPFLSARIRAEYAYLCDTESTLQFRFVLPEQSEDIHVIPVTLVGVVYVLIH